MMKRPNSLYATGSAMPPIPGTAPRPASALLAAALAGVALGAVFTLGLTGDGKSPAAPPVAAASALPAPEPPAAEPVAAFPAPAPEQRPAATAAQPLEAPLEQADWDFIARMGKYREAQRELARLTGAGLGLKHPRRLAAQALADRLGEALNREDAGTRRYLNALPATGPDAGVVDGAKAFQRLLAIETAEISASRDQLAAARGDLEQLEKSGLAAGHPRVKAQHALLQSHQETLTRRLSAMADKIDGMTAQLKERLKAMEASANQ